MAPKTQRTALPGAAQHEPRGEPRPSGRTRWRATVLILVHLVALAHVLHWWLSGETLSPVEPSEAWETLTYGAVNAGFILLVLLIVATLVVGRFFCGWACHVVAYQDLCAALLGRFGLRPKPIRSRLLALVPAYAALDIFVLPALARWRDLDPGAWSLTWSTTTDALWETFPGPTMAILTLVVDGFLVVWFFGSKGFCTYGCPYGALFGLADRAATGRIRVNDACEGCGHCTAACTSNVAVHREVAHHGMVVDPGCMKCLDCVSVCPKDALSFGFGAIPAGLPAAKRGRAQRSWDFSWAEELLLAAVFAGSVFAFRNLYGAVPFLLAVGLGVIVALCAVVPLRLVRERELRFQHLALRQDGRLTGAGLACLVAMPLALAVTAHSGAVQVELRRGVAANEHAAGLERSTPAFAAAVGEALAHLGRVERWSLVASAEVHNRQGQLMAATGDLDGAARQLRRAIELAPDSGTAHTALAETLLASGQVAPAAQSFLRAVELKPGEPRAATGLLRLLMQHPVERSGAIHRLELLVDTTGLAGDPTAQLEATVRAAEALLVDMQLDPSVSHLERALAADPDHLAARRCLAALLQADPGHAAGRALATELQTHDSARAAE